MRKTTLHDPADDEAESSPPAASSRVATPGQRGSAAHAARGRRPRVRNRLLAGVLLTGVAVLAAGAPALHGAWQRLATVSELRDDAQLGRRALAFSHTLAAERDALVVAAQAPDPAQAAARALPKDARDRTTEQAAQLRDDAPAALRERLDTLPAARERATSGEADPGRIHADYTAVIDELRRLLVATARPAPGQGAGDAAAAAALPELARAVDASRATRGLLLAALDSDGEPSAELTRLARRQADREADALAGFAATAEAADRDALRRAVADAPGAKVAEGYLDQLTATGTAPAPEDREQLDAALAARGDAQRAVLDELATEHVRSLGDQRAEELLGLQLRIGLLLAALALAFGVSVRTARSLTRPLAAVRLGSRRVAADPAGQQPVRYTGRDDEFAEVVASVNALHARAVELHKRATEMERDSGGLRAERDRLLAEQRELSQRLTALHGAVHGMFAYHAQRLLALVGEQLSVIEGLEEHETDPDELATLFTLDHLAARMRRHGENLLLLAGAGPVGRSSEPMPLIDVLRAAVSEIERYELVEILPPPAVRVVGPTARDLSHLLAELLDNATAFSPEGARVRLTGGWQEGGLTLQVEDEGVGLSEERLAELNARLADPVTPPPGAESQPPAGADGLPTAGIGMGLYTVARLAVRHGIRAGLRARPGGGTVAEVLVPATLLTDAGMSTVGDLPTMAEAAAMSPVPGPYPDPTAPSRAHAPAPPPPGPATPAAQTGRHAAGRPPTPRPAAEHAHAADTAPTPYAMTESGLPMRTTGGPPPAGSFGNAGPPAGDLSPHQTAPRPAQAHAGGLDAEELRRRLGGFQRGAREGHRDAARAGGTVTPASPASDDDEEAP